MLTEIKEGEPVRARLVLHTPTPTMRETNNRKLFIVSTCCRARAVTDSLGLEVAESFFAASLTTPGHTVRTRKRLKPQLLTSCI
jgi:hypothetical protein